MGHNVQYRNDDCPDSKVHGDNMGPIRGLEDPGGTHVGPMDFAIWVCFSSTQNLYNQTLD